MALVISKLVKLNTLATILASSSQLGTLVIYEMVFYGIFIQDFFASFWAWLSCTFAIKSDVVDVLLVLECCFFGFFVLLHFQTVLGLILVRFINWWYEVQLICVWLLMHTFWKLFLYIAVFLLASELELLNLVF